MKINQRNTGKMHLSKNHMLLAICGILAVVNVIMTIDGGSAGIEISGLQKKQAVLSDQRQALQDELVRALSVSELQEKSSELGFVKPTDAIYLSQSLPVAKLP